MRKDKKTDKIMKQKDWRKNDYGKRHVWRKPP